MTDQVTRDPDRNFDLLLRDSTLLYQIPLQALAAGPASSSVNASPFTYRCDNRCFAGSLEGGSVNQDWRGALVFRTGGRRL